MLFLLDTTVLIDYLRDAPAADQVEGLRERGDYVGTTAINVEEIARGLRPRERQTAQGLVRGLIIVPLGAEEGWRAGVWRREFSARGVTLAQGDCLIAAASVSAGAVLVTGNPRDFPMPEVRVDHWPAGK